MNPILTWYGHACFKLELSEGGSVIFDPYERGSVPGTELPDRLSADLVLCSHGHGDHNAADRVQLTGRQPDFAVSFLDTFHDPEGGRLRGTNRITVVEYGSFRAAHLGDLGCALTEAQMKTLTGLDLLLLPVGGHFTIGPEEAAELIAELQPRIAVPMHYRTDTMGYPIIAHVKEFLSLIPAYMPVGSNMLKISDGMKGIFVMG